MARNAIKSEFRTSKMADSSHFVKKIKKKLKFRIDRKWPEMRSKVNFGHPIWSTAVILSKISQKKVAYRSEMAKNAIESEFRTSKMGAGSHFVKKILKKICIDIKWSEMQSKVNFRHPKWPLQPFYQKIPKKPSCASI